MYQKTKNLSVVRSWIDEHDAYPAVIKDTNILKIKFDPECGCCNCCNDFVEMISWDDFCAIFKKLDLFFLYETEGDSEFYKIIFDHLPDAVV